MVLLPPTELADMAGLFITKIRMAKPSMAMANKTALISNNFRNIYFELGSLLVQIYKYQTKTTINFRYAYP